MTQPQEQALCPEDVLRALDREIIGTDAARLIRQMQAAIAEADRLGDDWYKHSTREGAVKAVRKPLAPFLPKPEPDKLVEAMREALPASMPDHHVAAIVRNLSAYCAKHGGTIIWKDGE